MYQFVPETEDVIRLRKYRARLMVCAFGMYLFGAWSVLKETMIYFAGRQSGWLLANAVKESGVEKKVFLIVLYSILFLDLIIRILLGSLALRVGRGRKQSNRYIVFITACAVVAIITMVLTATDRALFGGLLIDPLNTAVTIGVDVMATINTVELVVCSAKIRKLERSGVE